jgi:hypothetical protein
MKSEDIFLLYERQVAEFKLKLIRKLSSDMASPEKLRPKRTSNMEMVETVLKTADKPLHVNEIIDAIKEEFGIVLDRDSLSSALIKQVLKEKRFVRTAPNTFGLRET